MTKEQFDRQWWYKGIRVRVIGNPEIYEVEEVNFNGFLRLKGFRIPFLYRNLIIAEEDESRA